MPFNYLGDLHKIEVVGELNKRGFHVKDVHELNLILERMGLQKRNGRKWLTTKEGVRYTIYNCQIENADAWHPFVVDDIISFLTNNSF